MGLGQVVVLETTIFLSPNILMYHPRHLLYFNSILIRPWTIAMFNSYIIQNWAKFGLCVRMGEAHTLWPFENGNKDQPVEVNCPMFWTISWRFNPYVWRNPQCRFNVVGEIPFLWHHSNTNKQIWLDCSTIDFCNSVPAGKFNIAMKDGARTLDLPVIKILIVYS